MTRTAFPVTVAVVGVSWHQEIVASVREGERCVVEAEPDNPFDANAMKVSVEAGQVGHLSRAIAERLRNEGIDKLVGRVVAVLGSETVGLRIEISPLGAEDTSADADLVSDVAAPAATDDEPAASSHPAMGWVKVRSSGRRLGELVGEVGAKVQVRLGSGSVVGFPRALVEIEDTDALLSA